jgi:hypothetical protein
MTTKKALQVFGAFLSFFFILLGIYIMTTIPRVISLPDSIRTTYFIDVGNGSVALIGPAMISAGLTFLWFQGRK